MKVLVCIISLVLAASASGRIGETRVECEARYGTPYAISEANSYTVYKKEGMTVVAYFASDVCQRLEITKDRSDLTQAEAEALLSFNKGRFEWKTKPVLALDEWEWMRSDGAHAECTGQLLTIFTPEWMRWRIAFMRKEREKAKGDAKEKLEVF